MGKVMIPEENRKKKKLSRGMIFECVLFAALLSIGIGFIGFLFFSKAMIGKYEDYIEGVLNISMKYIDGDSMKECVESGWPDEKYQETQLFLNQVKNTHQIEYIYAVVPKNHTDENNLMYVITGISDEELNDTDNVKLGDLSNYDYTAEIAEYYWLAMENDGITYYDNNTEFGYMYSGLTRITDSNGTPVAVLAVDVSMADIKETLKNYFLNILWCCVVLTGVMVFFIVQWLKKRVNNPVDLLNDYTYNFIRDSHDIVQPEDLEFSKIVMPENDEMQVLSNSVYNMSDDIRNYMINLVNETRDNQRIASELNLATDIQKSMLPRVFPNHEKFEIHAYMNPAKEVGGDFYDFFMIDETHLGTVIADVSGKGVGAALFMVIAKTMIKNVALVEKSPAKILEIVNNQLVESNTVDMFVTVWLAITDLETGIMTASNAGHEYPAIKHGDEPFELYIDKHGLPLASMEDMPYTEYTIQLHKGDIVFVYTDGVPEATEKNFELFGVERMIDSLNNAVDLTPRYICDNIINSVDAFLQGAPQFDDLTMLCFKLI